MALTKIKQIKFSEIKGVIGRKFEYYRFVLEASLEKKKTLVTKLQMSPVIMPFKQMSQAVVVSSIYSKRGYYTSVAILLPVNATRQPTTCTVINTTTNNDCMCSLCSLFIILNVLTY